MLRLPAAPLLACLDRYPEETAYWATDYPSQYRAIQRIRAQKTVSLDLADKLCVMIGVHIGEVYGDAYWEPKPDDYQDVYREKHRAKRNAAERARYARRKMVA